MSAISDVNSAGHAIGPRPQARSAHGIGPAFERLDLPVETFDRIMEVNGRAALIVAQGYARDLLARGRRGAIVEVSSLSSFIGFAEHAACCASRGALDGLTRVMANELGRRGIRVNGVRPVVTLKPMAEKAWSDPCEIGADARPDPARPVRRTGRGCGRDHFPPLRRHRHGRRHDLPVDGGFLVN